MNTKNWMSKLNENLTLKNICMPGSHDAGIYKTDPISDKIPIVSSLALTQGLNMEGQLNNGIRYFDIRPEFFNNSVFLAWHGDIKAVRLYGDLIVNMLKAADNFINKNKTEFLILNFSHCEKFNGAVDKKFISLLLTHIDLGKFFILEDGKKLTDTKLSYLRGKILIRIENDVIFRDIVEAEKLAGIFSHSKKIKILDEYSNERFYEKMLVKQMEHFGKFNSPDKLFLLNWTLTPGGINLLPGMSSVKDYAEEINPRLTQYGQARDFLFQPNYYGQIVNIINGDFWEVAGSNVVEACLEVMKNGANNRKKEALKIKSVATNKMLHSGTCLDENQDPFQIQLRDNESDNSAQYWYKKSVSGNVYKLQNAGTGLYLRAATDGFFSSITNWIGITKLDNHLIGAIEESGDKNQHWHFESIQNNRFNIVNYKRKSDKESDDRLDGHGGCTYLHKPNNGDFQKWEEVK